jgi:protein-tyrosine phosphatase
MAPVRILICASEAPLPPLNGMRLPLVEQCERLGRRHAVTVLALRRDGQVGDPPEREELIELELREPGRLHAWASRLRALATSRPVEARRLPAPFARVLPPLLAGRRFDVTLGGLAGLAAPLRGVPAMIAPLDAWHLNMRAEAARSHRAGRPFRAATGARAMIDLHAHLLPGIDDGPPDEAGALALAAEAAAQGVRVMAATPHLREDFPDVRVEDLAARVAALREALARAGVDLEIVSGGEVDILWAQRASDAALRAASYGGRGSDLLVETPYGDLPPLFESLLFQIAARGFRILLAHPERNASFQRDPSRLAALVDRGTLVQVTAASLAAGGRSRSARLARRLIADGRAHVIASDVHSAAGRRATLAEGLAAAAQESPERARWMVTEAPAAILAGDPLAPPPAVPRRRMRPWR